MVVKCTENSIDDKTSKNLKSGHPKKSFLLSFRQEFLKWYGWGYNDSNFVINGDTIYFSGNRYPLGGHNLPYFTDWVKKKFDINLKKNLGIPKIPTSFPEPIINKKFLDILAEGKFDFSLLGEDRLIRCHGQTLQDIYKLWNNEYKRIPDLVIWPKNHNDVVRIVSHAHHNNIVLIPFGGGTSVSGSVTCPQNESRMIIILDTSQMNKMLWLDKDNLTTCFESGIVGKDLERDLKENGLTCGHEPDSYEFSTLGGWVATRASGMKKNVYGNIEDIIVKIKMVTTKGVLERDCSAPRISCGPDFNHIILGSEGTLGVITEVVLKVRPLPKQRHYGSLVFPNFSYGVQFMREVARNQCQPASIRLMDNEQFQFGQCLRPENSWFSELIEGIKINFIGKIKKFDLNKICVTTLLYEGDLESVRKQENLINSIAKRFNGVIAGAKSGERGYMLTFVIAYIRDLALAFEIVAESFETSAPWNCCENLCKNVKKTVVQECEKYKIKFYLISCRVTQTYDAGCCIYFYFGFKYSGLSDPIRIYESIEEIARNRILELGGSISHHHGVGKIRRKWYASTVSDVGVRLYISTKLELDPKNIFAAGNLVQNNDNNFTSKL